MTWDGKILKELREKAGLTQTELATRAGVTRDAIARWEAEGDNRREPGWSSVLALAAALGVDCRAFVAKPASTPDPEKKPAKEAEKPTKGRSPKRG